MNINRYISRILPVLLAAFLVSAMAISDEKEEILDIHNTVHCGNCHSMNSKISSTGEIPGRSATCQNCHDPLKSSANYFGFSFHDDPTRNCTDCHSFHKTDVIKAKESRFSLEFYDNSKMYNCVACHNKNSSPDQLSAGHQQASLLYHSDSLYTQKLSASENCLVCHGFNSTLNVKNSSSAKIPFINLHASHPNEVIVEKGYKTGMRNIKVNIDEKLKLLDNRIECLTCHNLSAGSNKLLAQFDSQKELCSGCHIRVQNSNSFVIAN
ncbi:MAG: hypothetical protein DWP97_10455 [Calditrichaeota bacterium]|nr:MAG: hypothetical protein DWP97_10455 [Calditrichota bacterium]